MALALPASQGSIGDAPASILFSTTFGVLMALMPDVDGVGIVSRQSNDSSSDLFPDLDLARSSELVAGLAASAGKFPRTGIAVELPGCTLGFVPVDAIASLFRGFVGASSVFRWCADLQRVLGANRQRPNFVALGIRADSTLFLCAPSRAVVLFSLGGYSKSVVPLDANWYEVRRFPGAVSRSRRLRSSRSNSSISRSDWCNNRILSR